MLTSPYEQIGKGQRVASKPHVELDAKVVQGHFGYETGLKTVEGMGMLTRQPEGIEQFAIDGLDNLSHLTSQCGYSTFTS